MRFDTDQDRMHQRTTPTANQGLTPSAHLNAMNFGGGSAGYQLRMEVGEIEDGVFFFSAKARAEESVFSKRPPWFRFVSVHGDTANFQENLDVGNEMWVGNIFVCDNPRVKLTVVVDGQAAGRKPFLEIHNPTDAAVTTAIRSPSHTRIFGIHTQREHPCRVLDPAARGREEAEPLMKTAVSLTLPGPRTVAPLTGALRAQMRALPDTGFCTPIRPAKGTFRSFNFDEADCEADWGRSLICHLVDGGLALECPGIDR